MSVVFTAKQVQEAYDQQMSNEKYKGLEYIHGVFMQCTNCPVSEQQCSGGEVHCIDLIEKYLLNNDTIEEDSMKGYKYKNLRLGDYVQVKDTSNFGTIVAFDEDSTYSVGMFMDDEELNTEISPSGLTRYNEIFVLKKYREKRLLWEDLESIVILTESGVVKEFELLPRKLHGQQRFDDIVKAISTKLSNKEFINDCWLEEYNEIILKNTYKGDN